MALVQVLSTNDIGAWHSLLPARRSVFGSVEYATVMQQQLGCKGCLFVCSKDEELIVSPLLLRPVSKLPFAPNRQEERWDAVSPEYTGPIALRVASHTAAREFQKCFAEFCTRERIITLFTHLHPWNWSPGLLEMDHVFLDREIVYVNLTLSEDQIWQECLTKICRKNVKKAHRETVRVFQAETSGDVREFHRVYLETIKRKQLSANYYYSPEYFMEFFQTMPEASRFTLAEYNGQIVAGQLCLYDDIDAYAYRGGMDYTFQSVCPVNALYYEAILWAKSQGKKRLVLGGGVRPNDGIFRFKADFSPLRANFYVYKQVYNSDKYDALCRDWSAYYGCSINVESYFPVYRSMPVNQDLSIYPRQ